MALTVRKKSSHIFTPPSYIKNNSSILESKVEKIINDTIREKIYSLLNFNKSIYIKRIEYFPIFTTKNNSGEKTLKSIMMRVKNKHMKFKEILAKEIELSGINILEFNAFLEKNGAREVYNCERQLENL